jgi:hypothetical protein
MRQVSYVELRVSRWISGQSVPMIKATDLFTFTKWRTDETLRLQLCTELEVPNTRKKKITTGILLRCSETTDGYQRN